MKQQTMIVKMKAKDVSLSITDKNGNEIMAYKNKGFNLEMDMPKLQALIESTIEKAIAVQRNPKI